MPTDPISYLIGILIGLFDGFVNNMGIVFQKMAINRLPEGQKVNRRLLKNKLWLFGFIMNGYMPLPFSMVALLLIGPTLVPGLEGSGMIFLALGSLKVLKERLKASEVAGILMIVAAIFSLVLSGLSIDISSYAYYLSSPDFFVRVAIFSVALASLSFFCFALRRTHKRRLGLLNALDSGFMWGINNFWFALIMAIVAHIVSGTFVLTEVYIIVVAVPLLISTEFLGVFRLQKSFEYGQAANMRPIQQTPIQIATIFYFFWLYLQPPPYLYSMPLAIIGIVLLLIGMYLLSQRTASIKDAGKGAPRKKTRSVGL